MGHALMEEPQRPRRRRLLDRSFNGHAEAGCSAALHMIEPRADRPTPITLGAADKAYDAEDFVNELRSMNATPRRGGRMRVAARRRSTAAQRDTRRLRSEPHRHPQTDRGGLRLEIKTIAGQERTKFRGRERVGWAVTFAAAAYNLARLPKLLEASALKAPANSAD